MAIEDRINVTYEGQDISVTASFGAAQLLTEDTQVSLVRRVDKALYAAKETGRNRVELAG